MSGTGTQNALLIPALGTPLLDAKTGKMTREWYRFFTGLGTAVGPSPGPAPDGPTDVLSLSGFAAQAIGMIQDLQQQISDLQQSTGPPSAGSANMLANAHIFVGNSAGQAADVPVSGDLSLANTGAFTIVTIAGQPIGTFVTQLIGKGTASNDSAAAGYIGQYLETVVTSGAPVTGFVNGTPKDVAVLALPAGDHTIVGQVLTDPAGGTTTSQLQAGISLVSNTLPAVEKRFIATYSPGAGQRMSACLAATRVSLAAPANVYLVAQADFLVSTMGMCGFINNRTPR